MSPTAGPVTVRCASCGWNEDVGHGDESIYGANHLRVCPKRDDLTLLPWWTTAFEGVFEVGWHPALVNEPFEVPAWNLPNTRWQPIVPTHRFRFTEYCDREIIGVRQAAA